VLNQVKDKIKNAAGVAGAIIGESDTGFL